MNPPEHPWEKGFRPEMLEDGIGFLGQPAFGHLFSGVNTDGEKMKQFPR